MSLNPAQPFPLCSAGRLCGLIRSPPRPRGRMPLILKIAPDVQRCSSLIVFAAAIIATLLQVLVWTEQGEMDPKHAIILVIKP